MHPFPGYATARSVGFGTGAASRVAPNPQQNAVPRRARDKRHSFHRQERICRATSVVPSRLELAAFQAQAQFARRRLVARGDVPC